ncbi:MAG TPA: helix-turn-helix transcriptional regulator [Rhodopila sp.]|nr:helix-turn-helix transcriptional regulator [Rhodopila sp.]
MPLLAAKIFLEALGWVSYTNNMSTSQDIGARIRATRRENGLTQDELADRVGVSRSAVAQWETGRAGQVTGNLSRIADALQVNVEYLMIGDDKRAVGEVRQGDELALLRLYRECDPEDRQMLLRTARRLVRR